MSETGWPNSHSKLDEIARKSNVEFPPVPEGEKKLSWQAKVDFLEKNGIKPNALTAGAPTPEPKKKDSGQRDATYEELYEYALSKGNSSKAANIFADNNSDRGGYIVRDGELSFSKERFDEVGGSSR
jgi:hypothetical protein